jgi:hypothetical protein
VLFLLQVGPNQDKVVTVKNQFGHSCSFHFKTGEFDLEETWDLLLYDVESHHECSVRASPSCLTPHVGSSLSLSLSLSLSPHGDTRSCIPGVVLCVRVRVCVCARILGGGIRYVWAWMGSVTGCNFDGLRDHFVRRLFNSKATKRATFARARRSSLQPRLSSR